MNAQRTTGNLPKKPASGPGRLLAIGLAALLLAACSGEDVATPVVDDTGDSTPLPPDDPAEAPVLDCERDSVPCSFAEVALPVVERSLALSDDAAQQLVDGVDIEQVAAWLEGQADVADVTVDGPVLGFRLDGGRPMIVDVTGDQEWLASAPASATAREVAGLAGSVAGRASPSPAARNLRTVRTAAGQKIVAGDGPERHALVLSPFRYEQNFGNAGELVAEALNGVRGYAGNVTYLATTDEFDPQVTVDVLTQLEDYDVVHIDTHGGTLCKDKVVASGSLAKDKDKKKCADGITDFLVQRFHGTAADLQSVAHPGVVHYRGRVHQSIAVTADFFRHYYPDGLEDRLFVLGSCNTFRTDMADAIAGERGVFLSWDGYTEFSLVRSTSLSLLDSLGLGLTVGEAFARMPAFSPENPEAQGTLQRTPRRLGGDLRIRNLMTVRDNLTGELVSNNSGIEVREVPGDGQNDHLDLEFTVDGITPEQLGNFYVNLVVDDHVIGHLDLQQSGVQVDEFRYVVSTPVPLPFDVEAGQALHLNFWIPLPDLGEDPFVAAPKVNGREEPEVGAEWVLTSRSTYAHTDDVTVKTASVTFELEPDDDPAADFHYFRVTSGSVHVQREYEDALGCRFSVDHTIEVPAGAPNNYLKFDASGQPMLLDGFGSVPSETVQTSGSCGESAGVRVGGVYFIAEDAQVSGDALQGGYNDGAPSPTIIEWSLSRTR